MESVKKYIAPAAFAFVTALIFVLLRTSPAYKLWDGYTVLSVSTEADKNVVNSVLEQQGCAEVISLENQKNDFGALFAPCLSLKEDDEYAKNKSLYFFDKENKVVLYYIPDAYKRQLRNAVAFLNEKWRINVSLDNGQDFPWLVPLVVLAMFGVFAFFSENRIVFALSGVFGVLFAFCNPFYTAAAAVCLELYAIYIIQKVWRRKDGFSFIFKNKYFLIFCIASIVVSFTGGIVTGILFLMNFGASFCLLLMFLNFEKTSDSQFRFSPLLICNAKTIGSMNFRSIKHMFLCSFGIFVLLLLLIISEDFSSGKAIKGLYFPAPKEYNNKNSSDFPALDDFVAKKWKSVSVQYISLNDKLSKELALADDYRGIDSARSGGEAVSWTRYKKQDGKIDASEQVLYKYNDEFKKNVLKSIDTLDYPAIEKLWKRQKRKFSVAYVACGSREGGFSVFGILLIAMFVPLISAFGYILVRRRKLNVI